MKLEFDTLEEVMDFASRIGGDEGETKTRRTRKTKDTAATSGGTEAPDPAGIPNGGNSPTLVPSDAGNFGGAASGPVFTPPGGGAFPGGPATGAAVGAAPGPSAPVVALVQRIAARVDAAIAQGQPAQGALDWLRAQCGTDAAQATLDQIKQTFLARLGEPQLESMAKLMGAV